MQGQTKKDTIDRLRRIAGQVQGIARMVDDDRSHTDVLVQLSSVEAALGKVRQLLLQTVAHDAIVAALESNRPADRKRRVDQLMDLIGRYGATGSR